MLASPLYFFILVLVAAVGVSAQTADACTLACVNIGLANSTCTSLCVVKLVLYSLNFTHASHIRSTNLSCVCNSTSFQQTAANCLAANCTVADQQAALQLQQKECGGIYLPAISFLDSPLTRLPQVRLLSTSPALLRIRRRPLPPPLPRVPSPPVLPPPLSSYRSSLL